MLVGPSGVAAIAKYERVHLNEPITGQVDSVVPICIAAAASRPGATKCAYVTPPGGADDLFTSVPSPIPSAAR